jgi:4-amino-4-deoxy-L-arabinose transferase-like glycosyltransferase
MTLYIVAIVLAALAVVLPPHTFAATLAGPATTAAHLAQVVTGVWILKAAFLLHALIALLVRRLRGTEPAAGRTGLAPEGITVAPQPASPLERYLLIGILVLGAALRIPGLGRGLWFDEIQTFVEYARDPLLQIISTFDSQNQHLLYSVLAKVAFHLTGSESAWALRLPAVCFGVASLAALVWFATRVTTRREALLAAGLLAVSYHHVWFSQDARGYTGLLFFTLIGSGCFLLLLAEPGQHTGRRVVFYAASMALAHLTHATAVLVTGAHALIWLVLVIARRRDLRNRAWRVPFAALVLAGTFSLLLYALVLPQFLGTLTAPPDTGSVAAWKDPIWMVTEGIRVLSAGIPGGLAAVGVALLVVGAGVASYWRRSRAATAVMLLPGLCTGTVVIVLSHNLWPRFFFFSAGFAVLIAIRGGFAIVRRLLPNHQVKIATAGAILICVLSLLTVPRAWAPKQDFDAARAYVQEHRAPADAVAVVDMTDYVYTRYYGLPWPELALPGDLQRLESTHPRTWIVVTFPKRVENVQPALWEHVTHSYRTAATFPGTVGGGALFVMVSR